MKYYHHFHKACFILLLSLILLVPLLDSHNYLVTSQTCSGIAAGYPGVCSGRGSCFAQDQCTCTKYSNQIVDYLAVVPDWGTKFCTPTPNTLFTKYAMHNTNGSYPTFSVSTKNQYQDMWDCKRGAAELILNTAPRAPDGSLYNEYTFELTINMTARGALTHVGMVLWRDPYYNALGKNYYIGAGPSESSINLVVNNDEFCSALPTTLANTYPGPFTIASEATYVPIKVQKTLNAYSFYYKNPGGSVWLDLGTINNPMVFDRIGIFIKQWSSLVFWYGGPISFDVIDMNAKVSKYFGNNCQLTSCYGISSANNQTVCSGHGVCSDFNTCVCNKDYSGLDCSISNITVSNSTVSNNTNTNMENSTISNTTVNSNSTIVQNTTNLNNTKVDGNGTFVYNNSTVNKNSTISNDTNLLRNGTVSSNNTITNSSVIVNNSTIPQNTTNPTNNTNNPNLVCNGISYDNETVCNSRGKCTQNGCDCTFPFVGKNCEEQVPLLMCYNLPSNDPKVCSGHGTCINPDECQCNKGYEGETCSSFSCYGKSQSSPTVCGGHGNCSDIDHCSCVPNWTGNECSECVATYTGVNCTEKVCIAAVTCNGKGNCVNNKCVCTGNFVGESCNWCKSGFYGTNCDVACSEVTTCSSQGACNSLGACECYGNFAGKTCSYCKSGWTGNKCDYSVDVTSFSFNANGDLISGIVYSPIKTNDSCSTFIAIESLVKIGSDAVCVLGSDNIFKIKLGPNAKIINGDSLKFYSNLDRSGSLITAIVANGSLVDIPIAVLTSDKTKVSTCESILFDASASFSPDGRSISYSWSSPNSSITSFIRYTRSSYFNIQENSVLTTGNYQLTVKITNQFGISSKQTLVFTVVAPDNVIPTVTFPDVSFLLIGAYGGIYPTINFPACYRGIRKLSNLTYSVEPNSADSTLQLYVANNGDLLFGQTYTSITKEGAYYIKAMITTDQGIQFSKSFMFRATFQELDLRFNVSDFSQAFDEYASFEVITNDPSATLESPILSITCLEMTTNTTCGPVGSPFNRLLAPGKYSFNAKYSKGSRSVGKVLQITILPESKNKVLKLSIRAAQGFRYGDIDISAVDGTQELTVFVNVEGFSMAKLFVKWSSLKIDLKNIETTRGYIVLPSNSLVSGETYSLDVFVTDGTKNGSASLSFTMNYPPTRGSFEVFPESGYNLDEFDLKCGNDWFDVNSPLSYQYFFLRIQNNGFNNWVQLSEKAVDLKSVRVRLAAGNSINNYQVPVKVVVTDSKGASNESIIQVTVNNLPANQTLSLLTSLSSQASSIPTAVASSAILAIGNVNSSSLDASQLQQLSQAANTLVTSVISNQQSSLLPVTSDSATSTASVISNTIPAVTSGLITDSTTSLIISALANTTSAVASVGDVNLDSSTMSSVLSATNALSEHVSSSRRRSVHSFTDEDLKNLGIAYTNIVAVSTKNNAPDMPASIVIGNGVIGYSRKLSSPSMNNFNDILYNSNTITLSTSFSSLIPYVASATFNIMIYDKRNAISKFSLDSNFDAFTKVIEINVVPEKTYAPISLSDSNLVRLRIQTLRNDTSIPENTNLVCKKYDNKKTSFNTDSGCTIGSFVSDSVIADVSSTGVYTLQAIIKEKEVLSHASVTSSVNHLIIIVLIVLLSLLIV